MKSPTKRRKYVASFKLKVVEVAKDSNNCAAARKFDVTEKMVREWRKKEDDLRKIPQNKCKMRKGSTPWPKLENEIAEWVSRQRQEGYVVTRNKIRSYALNWTKSNKDDSKDFKATPGWCNGFLNRNNLLIRSKTIIHQSSRAESGTSLHRFPKDPVLRSKWISFVQTERKNWAPCVSSAICSLHFTSEDSLGVLMKKFGCRSRVFLKPGAIPTIQCPKMTLQSYQNIYVRPALKTEKSTEQCVSGDKYKNLNANLSRRALSDPKSTDESLGSQLPATSRNYWIGLDWCRYVWIGLDMAGLVWICLALTRYGWIGLDMSGLD
ncbi:hypothetical protein Ahia01_000242400 [Argonauta hians]